MAFPKIMTNKKRKVDELANILPEELFNILPESRMYTQLQALERRIDATIYRKKLHVREAMNEYPKVFMSLMTTMSYSITSSSGDKGDDKYLCLRIYGAVIDPVSCAKVSPPEFEGFCQFFSKISVVLEGNVFPEDERIIEWIKTPENSNANGIEIKRKLPAALDTTAVVARIFFHLDHCPKKFKCSQVMSPLEEFLGINFQACTKSDLLRSLWQYIKTRKLVDSSNPVEIQCDEVFQQVFSCKTILFCDLSSKVQDLLVPAVPDEVSFNIDLERASGSENLNITVEAQSSLDTEFAGWYERVPSSVQEIEALDTSIRKSIDQIQLHKRRYEFLKSFSENPVEMVQYMVANQTRDLHMLSEADRLLEAQRSSSYYHHTGNWIPVAVEKYLEGSSSSK